MDKDKVIDCLENIIETLRGDLEWREEIAAIRWAIAYIRGGKDESIRSI